jgi:hypothetical protein
MEEILKWERSDITVSAAIYLVLLTGLSKGDIKSEH